MWLFEVIGYLLLLDAIVGWALFKRVNPWFATKLQSKFGGLSLEKILLIEGVAGGLLVLTF